ncbi:Nitrite reductase [NAD(P)H] large subunit [Marinobacter nauticus]|uniref:Nitrite reductase [NAD(P)H] large subunit n=2 Tax=Marinobacter nauticus TaxID=2743 RepID=A0A833JTB9_MARNT|nr:Nitrite reductase [NAD(P)H] large subunit [Marinobacter nauticus]
MLRLFSLLEALSSMEHTQDNPLVICGHGMVAQRLLEQLVAQGHPFSRIVVFNGEPFAAYNRIQLSSLLADQIQETDLELKPWQWFRKHSIEVHQHEPVTHIDPGQRQVTTACGRIQPYHTLVLATGAQPSRLGLPGEDLDGVMNFRDLADTRTLIRQAKTHRRAVVIGGGFLGLEAAEGLRTRGMDVTVLHRSGHLLNRQLNPIAGDILKQKLQQRGLSIRTGTSPVSLLGRNQVRAVELSDGTVRATDLVVIATGIEPNKGLAADAGLNCDRGIRVNPNLMTSNPHIYALGECCQFQEHTFGLVEPGYEQARILAQLLCQVPGARAFEPGEVATRLKISDLPIFSCGRVVPGEHTEIIEWQDRTHAVYGQLLLDGNRLAGAILLGDTANGPWYSELIRSGADVSRYRDTIAFGKTYCDAAA